MDATEGHRKVPVRAALWAAWVRSDIWIDAVECVHYEVKQSDKRLEPVISRVKEL